MDAAEHDRHDACSAYQLISELFFSYLWSDFWTSVSEEVSNSMGPPDPSMIAGSQEMSVRHSSFQFRDEAELEQALSIAEDAREEAARVAHELDVSHALLAQRERELLALQVEMEKRESEAAARLREMEDRLL